MPKIIKAYDVKVDPQNKINIEIANIATLTPFHADRQREEYVQTDRADQYVDEVQEYQQEIDPTERARQIVDAAKAEAESILENARQTAEDIIANATADAKKNADRIKEQSRQDGHDAGITEANAEAERIKAEARELYTQAENDREEALKNLEPEIVRLIVDITEKLLMRTVIINPGVVVNLVKDCLANTTTVGDIVIHVSEDDYELVSQSKNDILSVVDTSTNVSIIKDSTLNISDCVIETQFGNIDCSLDQQFQALKSDLFYLSPGV